MAKPLPPQLRLLVTALRQDKAHSIGRAALFALGVDLNLFEANIPQIAIETNISEARLWLVAAEARQAINVNAPWECQVDLAPAWSFNLAPPNALVRESWLP
jgi:hypothetical protein